MTKKRSMVGFLVLLVVLVFVTTSVYGGAREVRARYGPGYDKWIGTLIPEEFEFGPEDEVGRLNWMNPSSVLQAVRLVKRGKVYDLSFTVDRYSPNWPGHPPFEMITFRSPFGERNQGDQGWMAKENNAAGIAFASEATIHCQHTGTHIDNIVHVVFGPNAAGYNGISLNTDLGDFGLLKAGSETVPPIVCRGIMLDVAAYKGMRILPAGYEITIDDLKGTMRKQGVSIKKGDCVTVEQVKDNANVRRVDPVMCEPESQDVVQEVTPELQEEATECYDAKQELLNAEDDAAVERAARKVKILCNS